MTSPTAVLSPVRSTTPKQHDPLKTAYADLLKEVKQAGLLKKTPKFYIQRFIIITFASLLIAVGLIVASNLLPFWGTVGVSIAGAILFGICAAQYGFIAHEAAHKQIFQSSKWNEWSGRVLANLLAGLSYGFWIKKHNRHHGKPNQVGYDPDINIRVLSFTTDSLENKKGVEKWLSKNQGWLFPFLLFFTGFDLLLDSLLSVLGKGSNVKHRVFEFACMVVRQTVPFLFFWFITQNIFVAAGLWLVMMMTFGLFLGMSFAPNHKGMALVPENSKIGFFERQVLTSRNIRSNWWSDNFMGGLNFQIEHHLFPSMSRPHLREAHKIVKRFCEERNVPFHEVGFFASYKVIISYLNRVGLSNNTNPFDCPMVEAYRPVR